MPKIEELKELIVNAAWDIGDDAAFNTALNEALDELKSDDFFGPSGSTDPRGVWNCE